MGLQMRIEVNDSETDFSAYVVVDRLINGRAMGGTRMTADVDLAEVADLAKAMTLKLALADLPIGGAKAGITCGLPPGPARDWHLTEFGRAVGPLLRNGIYLGCDQGISYRDRDVFFAAAGYDVRREAAVRLPCDWSELWGRCHQVTGFGVCEAVDAATERLGLGGGCRTVAVVGFGTVGRAVATGLAARGLRVVAVADRYGTLSAPDGLPVADLVAATDESGTIDRDRVAAGTAHDVRAEAWLDAPVDVLVLAAGGDMVNTGNVDRVRATVVVEAGNLACTTAATETLAARGVVVLPGIAVNCGAATVTGLLLLGGAPIGGSLDDLVDWLFVEVRRRIRATVAELLRRARTDRRPLDRIADELARERLAFVELEAAPHPAEDDPAPQPLTVASATR